MSTFQHELILSAEYEVAIAERIRQSLAVEAEDLRDERSRTKIGGVGGCVEVQVEAADLIALRAALNTWGDLLRVAEAVEPES